MQKNKLRIRYDTTMLLVSLQFQIKVLLTSIDWSLEAEFLEVDSSFFWSRVGWLCRFARKGTIGRCRRGLPCSDDEPLLDGTLEVEMGVLLWAANVDELHEVEPTYFFSRQFGQLLSVFKRFSFWVVNNATSVLSTSISRSFSFSLCLSITALSSTIPTHDLVSSAVSE